MKTHHLLSNNWNMSSRPTQLQNSQLGFFSSLFPLALLFFLFSSFRGPSAWMSPVECMQRHAEGLRGWKCRSLLNADCLRNNFPPKERGNQIWPRRPLTLHKRMCVAVICSGGTCASGHKHVAARGANLRVIPHSAAFYPTTIPPRSSISPSLRQACLGAAPLQDRMLY